MDRIARRLAFVCTSALCAALLASVPRAQIADPFFPAADGWISALATRGDTLFVGGGFTTIGGVWTGACARFTTPGGELDRDLPRVEGVVYASAADGAGGWYLGGRFTSVSGVPRTNLAHIRADGSLSTWAPSADNAVRALLVRADRVYAGGDFVTVSGVARRGVAALDRTSGALQPWSPEVFGSVMAIAARDTTIYLGGTFFAVSGQARPYLAGIGETSGSVLAFNPNVGPTTQYPWVSALAVQGDTLFVGGYFGTVSGLGRRNLCAVDALTGLPLAWTPNPDGSVSALVVGETSVFVGGSFQNLAGESRGMLAGFQRESLLLQPWNPVANQTVSALALQSDTLIVGGSFSTIGGIPRRYLAAFRASSGTMVDWSPAPQAPVLTVNAIPGVRIAAGQFTHMRTISRDHLAAIDLRSGEVLPWAPSVNATVSSIATTDRTVFVGGAFTSVSGQTHAGLAAIDRASGAVRPWSMDTQAPSGLAVIGNKLFAGWRFHATVNGAPRNGVGAFDATTGALLPWAPSVEWFVTSLAAHDSTLYAGGYFLSVNGQGRLRTAAFHAGTGALLPWAPEPSAYVSALLADDSSVYIGGDYSFLGTEFHKRLSRVDRVSGAPQAWGFPGGTEADVLTMARIDSMLFVGGSFLIFGNTYRPYLAAVGVAGGQVLPWDFNADGHVAALATHGRDLIAGGSFSSLGGRPQRYLARVPDPFAFTPLSVTLLSPAGGEVAAPGHRVTLRWVTSGGTHGVRSVDLELSRAGSAGPWEQLAAGLADRGTFDWVVTPPVTTSNAFVRVTARDFNGSVVTVTNTQPFSIRDDVPPTLDASARPPRIASLLPIAPLPVVREALIAFQLAAAMGARLSLLDLQGREVSVLAEGRFTQGRHEVAFKRGALRAGVYFVRLTAAGTQTSRRIIVVR